MGYIFIAIHNEGINEIIESDPQVSMPHLLLVYEQRTSIVSQQS